MNGSWRVNWFAVYKMCSARRGNDLSMVFDDCCAYPIVHPESTTNKTEEKTIKSGEKKTREKKSREKRSNNKSCVGRTLEGI